jgi:hypothetical protein
MVETTEEKLNEFRIERFMELGFTSIESKKLAESKGTNGFPIPYQKVKAALDMGCTNQLAVRIFSN